MAEHVFDGWGDSFTGSLSQTVVLEWGVPFTVQRSGEIHALRYYHFAGADQAPTSLALWAWAPPSTAPTLVERVTLPSPAGSTGWVEVSLSTGYFIAAGEHVIVSGKGSSGWKMTYLSDSPKHFQPRTLTAGLSTYNDTGSLGFSTADAITTFATTVLGFDFTWDPVPFGDFTLSELTEEFERWLTTGGDKYPESDLPAIKGQAEGANSNAQNAWITAQSNQTEIAGFRTDWPSALAGKLSGAADFLRDVYGAPTPLAGTSIKDVVDNLSLLADVIGNPVGTTIAGFLNAILGYSKKTSAPPQLAEGDDWEIVDETDFTNNLLWPVEADLYRVTLSSFDPAGTSEAVGTETRHAYLGKWCPFNVQFSSEWHYFNTDSADLYLGGRMPGLGLILYRPGTGHVQAWRRVEAA